MNFVEYITNLAPEGETALVVRQKPQLDGNGMMQAHADGTIKCTWPAFLPTAKVKKDWAIYGNTGSFILDRFADGKVSASAANCEYVLVMMLDDIGTKSKEPPLPPTWIMETSEGSFQWGYAFKEQPTKGDFTAAIKAIAKAGYTDPGATNAVRNFRLPGSVNLKPGRDNFVSKLIHFKPELEYTLEEICTALGVVPDPADTATNVAIRLADTGKDSVVTWLNEQGMILSPANGEGWMGIVCPNNEQHTDGNIEGRYKPLDRSFCCLHGHCVDFSSQMFLDWVADNGGPEVDHGLRDELLAEKMNMALSKLTPNDIYRDTAAELIAEVERKELGRIEKAEWYSRFAYIQDDESYFDMQDRREVSRQTFNALFRHTACKSIHTGRKVEASICFDENRQAMGAKALVGVTYAAGEDVIVTRDGDLYGNRWRDARPELSGAKNESIAMWMDHCKELVPEADELEHIFDVMAFKVQHPKIKVNHAVLHAGDEGSGKDTFWAPFIWAICGDHLKNRGIMDNNSVNSQWGYQLESEVLIINELKEPDASTRRQLANQLKPIIAAPPEMLPINRKGLHPYMMANRLFVLAFSNDPVPISLASQDRRWFCVWSTAPRMDSNQAKKIWDWYRSGGFGAIARWLLDRDVSKFNPSAPPMWTEFKANLVEHGMSMAESYLVEMLKNRTGEFSRGVIGSPFHSLCDRLAGLAPSGVKVPQAALLHALKEAGWVDCGRIKSRDYDTKKHIFACADMAELSKSELRRMVEENPPPKMVLVK
ncbi:MAG: primase-helicase family protein [Polynucleobacter sp.]